VAKQAIMTPAEAAALHARASPASGVVNWVSWVVTLSDPAHPGCAVAYAVQADKRGGHRLTGELVADTIEDVRAMLPPGLKRMYLTGDNPKGAVETWD
jgi:hypothetical protein